MILAAKSTYRIGVISDTHGLLRPQALVALRGSDLIVHAGDVDGPEVLEGLRRLAPVVAVRGNVDRGAFGVSLKEVEFIEVGGLTLYVRHILDELDLEPAAAGFAAVIYGHSHVPSVEVRRGVVYFNPGSAGPKRFSLPVSLGVILVEGGRVEARLIELEG
ncbi:MAG: metallophosphoesterase family protein [Meiothermus sp.]|nr:metallophosphoesterase family protein [Meiothermus sp.]